MHKALIVHKLRENKHLFAEKYHINRVGLFGSYSQNKHTPSSDIDLVYEMNSGKRLGIRELYELELFFQKLLGTKKIDLVNKSYVNPIIEAEMNKSVVYV